MTTGKINVVVNSIKLQSEEEGPHNFVKLNMPEDLFVINLGIVIP